MGWLLGSKSKKKSARRKPARPSGRGRAGSPRSWDPQRTLLGLKLLGGFALVLLVVIAWRLGEGSLMRYVAEAHSQPVTAESVELRDAPAWMSAAVRQEIRGLVAQYVEPDPLDGRSLRLAAEALRREAWVASVDQVRRLPSGRVAVWADYREPVAVVQTRQGYHLVDAGGTRLPGLYVRPQVEKLGLPLIVGADAPGVRPPASPGQAWTAPALHDGLALVALLSGEGFVEQVRAFDVGQRDAMGRVRLVLHTAEGMVRWGLPPGQEGAVEPAASVKLAWLRQLAESRGSIDAGGRVVDIYGARVQVTPAASVADEVQAGYRAGW